MQQEVGRESLPIALNLLIQTFGVYTVQQSQVTVNNYPLFAYG